MNKIQFTIVFKSKSKRKIETFISLFEKKIALEIINLKIEKYWKVEGDFLASFQIVTDDLTNEKRVYRVLELANLLETSGTNNWVFNGPYVDQNLVFECFFNQSNDQPLKWAHVELLNE